MRIESSDYINLAAFKDFEEAEALRLALGRQWVDARLVVEGTWWDTVLGVSSDLTVRVQVRDKFYDEARQYLRPDQLEESTAN